MLAHVTPGEVATLVAAFAAGLVIGAAVVLRLLARRTEGPKS